MADTTMKLACALGRAQARCKAVAHDALNAFHKYRYTSAEAVIAEGKEALASEGLSLLPLEQAVNVAGEPTALRFELVRRFALMHSSGEERQLVTHWPVVPDKGRPLDKAVAGAATTSLAYLLRDLLLMPRVDEADDLAGREERPHVQVSPPRQVARPSLMGWFNDCEKALVAKGAIKPGELFAFVKELAQSDGFDFEIVDEWPAEADAAYRADVTRWGKERLAAIAPQKQTVETAANGR